MNRLFLLLISSLLFFNVLHGQLPSGIQAEVDSLNHEIEASSDQVANAGNLEDLIILQALFDPERALAISQQIIDMGESTGDERIQAIGLRARSRLVINGVGGQLPEAFAYLAQAEEIFVREGMKKDELLTNSLQGLCYSYFGEVDTALILVDKAVTESRAENDADLLVKSLRFGVVTAMTLNNLGLADSLNQEMIGIARSIGDDVNVFNGLINSGEVQSRQGSFPKSIEIFLDAKEFAISKKNNYWEAQANFSLGQTYMAIHEFENAKVHAKKAVSLFEENNAETQLQRTYGLLGGLFLNFKGSDSTIFFLEKALAINPDGTHPFVAANMMVNLAEAYLDKEEWDQALAYTDTVDLLLGAAQPPQVMSGNLYRKAHVYYNLGKLNLAYENGMKAFEMAEAAGYEHGIVVSSELVYNVHKKRGNYAKALEYYEIATEHKNKALNEGNMREVSRLEEKARYQILHASDSIKAEEQLNVVEAQAETEKARADQQTQRIIFLLIGLFIVVGIGGIAIYFLVLTRKQKREISLQRNNLEKRDREKQLLLKEIHHRVKNNLQIISSLLELQSYEIEDQLALNAVEDGQNRVKSIGLIHEMLYQTEDLSLINFEAYTKSLLKQISSLYSKGRKVQWKVNTDQLTLDIDTAIPIGLIMNELLTNSFKYGVLDPISGGNEITLKRKGEDSYQLLIKDSGPGLPEDVELKSSKSMGLRLVKNLARQLYGSVEYYNDHGANFVINFMGTNARKAVE